MGQKNSWTIITAHIFWKWLLYVCMVLILPLFLFLCSSTFRGSSHTNWTVDQTRSSKLLTKLNTMPRRWKSKWNSNFIIIHKFPHLCMHSFFNRSVSISLKSIYGGSLSFWVRVRIFNCSVLFFGVPKYSFELYSNLQNLHINRVLTYKNV